MLPNTASRNRHATSPRAAGPGLARDATPGKVLAESERDRDNGVQVRAGDGAHEQDDRHHHQPGRDDRRSQADLPLSVEDPSPSRDEDQHERPQQLREQPPILERPGRRTPGPVSRTRAPAHGPAPGRDRGRSGSSTVTASPSDRDFETCRGRLFAPPAF